MSTISSTAFPPPTFPNLHDEDDSRAVESLRETLKSLMSDEVMGDPFKRIPAKHKPDWIPVVEALSNDLLASFPTHDACAWSELHTRIKLVDLALDVIRQAISAVDTLLLGSNSLAEKLFIRLLGLCTILDGWVDLESPEMNDIPSPRVLEEKTLVLAVNLLRYLGGGSVQSDGGSEEQPWKIVRRIMSECVEVSNDLINLSPLPTFPLVVTLFKTPRLHEARLNELGVVPQDAVPTIVLGAPSHFATFLGIVLNILADAIRPTLLCQWFLTDISRRIGETILAIFHHCLSTSCSTTATKRARSLNRIIAAASLLSNFQEFSIALGDMDHRVIRYRLEEGPKPEWNAFDASLVDIFGSRSITPPIKANLFDVIDVFRTENWGDNGKNLRVSLARYIQRCLPHLDINTLRALKDYVLDIRPNETTVALNAQIDQQLSLHDSVTGEVGMEVDDTPMWRVRVRLSLEKIVSPEAIQWIEDDGDFTEQQYVQRVLDDIKAWSTRPFKASSVQARLSVAEEISKISCLVSHCDKSYCQSNAEVSLSTIPVFVAAIAHLLEGHGAEVELAPQVRRRAYNALARVIKHHHLGSVNDGMEYSTEMIFRGLVDQERSVRLSAGYALSELIKIYHASSPAPWKRTELIFAHLYRLLDAANDPIKDTTLVTVKIIGNFCNGEILGQVVCFLIAQLGQKNPVVKGTAYIQFLAVAKHHKKSPYSLAFPYLHQIAPFLVSRMCSHPSLLAEACRLLLVLPHDFISITLPRTLPQLFASCENRVLAEICKELATKPSTLFLNHSHEILAHAFLLPGPGQTNKALAFIVKVLTDATNNAMIDIQSVVKSCVVPLLAELVIVMGEENQENVELATHALKKVERSLFGSAKGNRVPPSQDLGTFLKIYMLGIISNINEMLQDVHGKKSMVSKRQILRSLGALISQIGPAISSVAPQIMATFQTMIAVPELAEVTLESWYTFLTTLGANEIGPHVGPTSASFVLSWSSLSVFGRSIVKRSLHYVVLGLADRLGKHLDEVADLAGIPELHEAQESLQTLRNSWTPRRKLERILERMSSDNLAVVEQSLIELRSFMLLEHNDFVRELASGDIFDPLVSQILAALFAAACRDSDGTESLRLLAFECIGVLGAVDPDRCEIKFNDPRMIMLGNFTDEGESMAFALHLITDLLVGAFRSTSDIKYQSHLAYSIQELLKFCKFTPSLVTTGTNSSVPIKVRNRWSSLPKQVLETVTPLLEARFTLNLRPLPDLQHPIYPNQSTYREWIQLWTTHLITKAAGPTAQIIFGVFRSAVRNKDVGVAHHLLPHLVLNILISGNEEDTQGIRSELLAVLEDQDNPESNSTADKKLLSAQAVFMLLDHLNKWVRIVHQDISTKKAETKRARANQINSQAEEQLLRVDSILSSIDQNLMARAALQCKAYARSLMNFERQIVTLRERSAHANEYPPYYERLHEIYAHLDEPDGMEGVSSLILSPSLEHQIRQHESTGRWTSAQSCWEVRLQHSPDNLDFHLGLLRCLRNLGHYDTLRTHVSGVLIRNPDWEASLAGFQVESAWMVGAWDDVHNLVIHTKAQTSQIVIARVLLAMRTGEVSAIAESLLAARSVLGAAITASGVRGYRRSYDAVLDLHVTHELEVIRDAMTSMSTGSQPNSQSQRREALLKLTKNLSARLDATLPTFRTREPVLSMRRTAFALFSAPRHFLAGEIGRSWLASAKIARKAGQWQTAYSAMLQAQQNNAPFSFIESAKLIKTTGEPLRALQELENSMRLVGFIGVLDLTAEDDDDETKKMKAKAQVLRARWMNESDRFETSLIFTTFKDATDLWPKWESGNYHLGQYHDECFKALSTSERKARGIKMNHYTIRFFAKAIKYGSKYVYQTVPRLLTIWLDLGEDRAVAASDVFKKVNDLVAKSIIEIPAYKWFTAFPQIVSRVGHSNVEVYKHLSNLIVKVMQQYPNQALWLFTSVVKSTKQQREQRGRQILDQLRNNPGNTSRQVPLLINQCVSMTNELLALCDHRVDNDSKVLSMKKDFPRLAALGRSPLIIPLQESLTASLPPTSSSDSIYQPFPSNAPTFEEFFDDIDVMHSLAKPRKITIRGSNGQIYMFLGKPKDDLRKDARLMDFNAIINKLLKANSESRRRQLRIRTYGVVTLNEECGFIQWVPNTTPVRPIIVKSYESRRIRNWSGEMSDIFKKIKDAPDKEAGQIYSTKIMPMFPPVFHDWFIETFPEPTAWLASRLAYGRTAAVMSMVGFILGLGDRHCENILLDTNSGDVVHVDFNCLFEKGKTLETPERVPFRLTQNIIDGLGVTGVEGVFRIACEVTMQLLRDNKDSLMSVLDAFIHDPLVEWEDEKRKLEREPSRRNNVKASVDLHMLAKNALNPIEKKLKGIYSTSKEKQESREISTSNLVQILIQEATDPINLAKMYPGWASWH